jgi:hypothetical protein
MIYCRSLGPNPTQTLPTWTVVCVAFRQGHKVRHHSTILGQNASAREAAFQALVDATALVEDIVANSPSTSITLLMADHFVLPYCQITDCHDNAATCRAICDTVGTILTTHTNMKFSIRWILGKLSFYPLECLQTIMVEATRHSTSDLNLSAPTPEAL